MSAVALHFAIGTAGSLVLFLVFTRLSGTGSFSAPFFVIFIGITCASLAHFVSPWATPIVLLVYLLSCINELRVDRAIARKAAKDEASE